MYLSTWHKNHVNPNVLNKIFKESFLRREIRSSFPWFTHQKTRSRVSFHEEPANQINSPPSTETSYIAVWHQQCSKDVPRHGPVVGVRFRPWMEMFFLKSSNSNPFAFACLHVYIYIYGNQCLLRNDILVKIYEGKVRGE